MKKLLIISLLGILSGCSSLTKPNSATTPLELNKPTLVQYAQGLDGLSIEAEKKELAQLSASPTQNDLTNKLKVAMIYAIPSSKLRDTSKAQSLLEDLLREKDLNNEQKALAVLLRDYVTENNKLAAKFRDEQKRADALQKKLDELKNIEKTMNDREQGSRK